MKSDTPEPQFEPTQSRNEDFAEKVKTKIWLEEQAADNPYNHANAYCYGYDLLDLVDNVSYSDAIFLLLKGELPQQAESKLFKALMISFMNPGPRDHGARAAIQAAIGKTDSPHILPIGLSIFAGEHSGSRFIEETMRFAIKSCRNSTDANINLIYGSSPSENTGFGTRFGSKDIFASRLLSALSELSAADSCLNSFKRINDSLEDSTLGILPHGVVAAGFCDLGFLRRHAPALLQMISAPGILAHGLEFVGKPRNQVPFLSDDRYEIISEATQNED